jgi:hypothetical protein
LTKRYIVILVCIAAADGLLAWLRDDSLRSYGETLVVLAALFCAISVASRLSAIEENVRILKQRLPDTHVGRPVFMHEYLNEQAAWRTTERLDGTVDSDTDREHNPETHDLVVKGVKCFEIGRDYQCGLTVPENRELADAWYRKAVPWYQLAAEKGDSYAQDLLGDFYSDGLGIEQDIHRALSWWRESANNGRVSAQYRLGEKYYFGRGLDKNLTEAAFWFQIVLSDSSLGFAEEKRQAALYSAQLAPEVLTEVEERVSKWVIDRSAKHS